MYEVLYLLAFSMCLANCACVRNIIMGIRVKEMENKSRTVECQSRPDVVKLEHGELIELITDVPYEVDKMWCETPVNNLNTTGGKGHQQLIRIDASQQGKWNCIYMLNTNETVQPIVSYNNRNFTKATCNLTFEVISNLWFKFTGMDHKRITKTNTKDDTGVIYKYKYLEGEFLNISCERNPNVRMYNFTFSTKGNLKTNLTGKRLEDTADSCFFDAKLTCKSKSPYGHIQLNFEKISDDLAATPSRSSVKPTSVAPFSTTPSLLLCDTMNTPTTTITALSGSTGSAVVQNTTLNMMVDSVLQTNNDTNTNKTEKFHEYKYEFSKPGIKNISCQFNKENYRVEIYDRDNTTFRQENKQFDGDKITVSLNFTLEKSDKTVICKATEEDKKDNDPRTFNSTLNMVYKTNTNEISELEKTTTTTTTESATTTLSQSPLTDASSFLKENGLLIGVVCAIVITLCVVACCLKIMFSKSKPQPPEDHVNLTSDRGNDYNTTTAAPIRTMPKIESNYCNPKDSQGRKNNADPNYSEPKEPQGMGEGLYAELNRPEDTYAEPYIDKTELMYARPIPKAQRKKKEDPNYGNVFGLYANSKK